MPLDDMKTRITRAESPDLVRPSGAECIVQIYGKQLGRRLRMLGPSLLIGRSPDANVVVDSDTVSRHHARIDRGEDGALTVHDLQSTNGTFINDHLVASQRLVNGDFLRIGDSIFKFLAGDDIEAAYHEEIYRMTILDGLTRIHNKRYLAEFLEREFSRARRHGRSLSLIAFDIDHFKNVNDQYGHLTGDGVLQELALLVAPRIRRDELLARAGGEEFTVVLPEGTLEVAERFAEFVRRMVARHTFVCDGHEIPVTISLGVATLAEGMERPEDLVRAADQALYRAKRAGRNRVSR
jgi:two-component system, cell cycle response regulator